jgi:site-specific DNA-methyltransferase (adenine-specific)
MNVVDQFYDLIDECCMKLNEKLHLNYFDCLVRVANDILYEVNDSKLEEDDLKFLEEKYDQLPNIKITNEEVRLAMQLLIIKAMKHINMNLEIMTPDYINYIIGYLVNSYYKGTKKKVSILDVEVGTGNLINTISNFSEFETNLIGVENNQLLIDICKANTELQNNEITLYFQDVLTTFLEEVDVIVGDLDCDTKENKYYPYEIILNYLPNLNKDGIFIYLIENDFFTKEQINNFKKDFQGTFLGLIVLPQNLFNKEHIGKSLLIGTSKKLTSFEMMIMQLSDINNKDKFYKDLEEIQNWIKKIKEI